MGSTQRLLSLCFCSGIPCPLRIQLFHPAEFSTRQDTKPDNARDRLLFDASLRLSVFPNVPCRTENAACPPVHCPGDLDEKGAASSVVRFVKGNSVFSVCDGARLHAVARLALWQTVSCTSHQVTNRPYAFGAARAVEGRPCTGSGSLSLSPKFKAFKPALRETDRATRPSFHNE